MNDTPQTPCSAINIVVKTVLVKMMCKCGGEMKPTGTCYTSYPPHYPRVTSYPPHYPHVCNKCGTNATYNVSYPEIRYVTE